MSTPIDTVTYSGLFPIDLDGKRPTAQGMPSHPTGHDDTIAIWYRKQRLPDTPEVWLEQYKYATGHLSDAHIEYCLANLTRTTIRRNEAVAKQEARDKLASQLGPREFTLTYSPSWYQDDASAQDAMRVAVDKLTRYYKNDIHEFRAVGEYTKAGRAHVHCYYLLTAGKKITDKNFKRAWPHWDPRKKHDGGHQGGHHANVRSLSDFSAYVEKDLDTAWLDIHITKDGLHDPTEDRSSTS